jgi:hypothetical protein
MTEITDHGVADRRDQLGNRFITCVCGHSESGGIADSIAERNMDHHIRTARKATRYALVNTPDSERIAPYLPSNYRIEGEVEGGTLISGTDSAGWTMDDYVLPRLGSGLYFGHEVTGDEARDLAREAELNSAATEIASSITEAARGSGSDPIAWVTGNAYMPPLRSFSAAEKVWQDDSDGENFAHLHELVEARLADTDVALECPDYDNALYAVDLRRFEYVDDPGDHETLQQDWQPRCCDECEGTE